VVVAEVGARDVPVEVLRLQVEREQGPPAGDSAPP
jgi:hypothetical protein